MATVKKSGLKAPKGKMSWKQLLVSASVTLNIAFVVVLITLATTHALDGLWMREGLTRYCSPANDSKFDDMTEASKSLRDFTCAKGDAADDFEAAVKAYQATR